MGQIFIGHVCHFGQSVNAKTISNTLLIVASDMTKNGDTSIPEGSVDAFVTENGGPPTRTVSPNLEDSSMQSLFIRNGT